VSTAEGWKPLERENSNGSEYISAIESMNSGRGMLNVQRARNSNASPRKISNVSNTSNTNGSSLGESRGYRIMFSIFCIACQACLVYD
jgi:hypothetical protein